MKAPIKLNSITIRLILLSVSIILFSSFTQFSILTAYLRKDITKSTSIQLLTIANYVASNIDRDIIQRRELLKNIAKQFPQSLLHNEKELQKWLGDRHEINPLFSQGIAVINLSGTILGCYPQLASRVSISFKDRDYFQKAIKGEYAMGSPVLGRLSKVPILPMAEPLFDSNGKVCAVIVGVSSLRSSNFMEALYVTRIGKTGGLVVVSPKDKLVISASDMDMILKPTPAEGVHPQHDRAMKGFRGVGIDVNAGGVEELAAIASIPSTGWFLVARMTTKEVFEPIGSLRIFIIKSMVILIPVFCILMVIGLRYQLSPLRKAAQYAEKMSQGAIPFESLPLVRDDEVGHLTSAFNGVLSNLLESRAEISRLAITDKLTGLFNRLKIDEVLQREILKSQRYNSKLSIILADIDNFKCINDTYGHLTGDKILVDVAKIISSRTRKTDLIGRWGGEEFIAICLETDIDNAVSIAEEIRTKIESYTFDIGNSVTLSIGVSTYKFMDSIDTLIARADSALYDAKRSGKNKVMIC
ncbi:MAG: diguanylate cyclase [Desulfamplus sp.]|nr:diguanylate cyclase [Desulfamplus sp.]